MVKVDPGLAPSTAQVNLAVSTAPVDRGAVMEGINWGSPATMGMEDITAVWIALELKVLMEMEVDLGAGVNTAVGVRTAAETGAKYGSMARV